MIVFVNSVSLLIPFEFGIAAFLYKTLGAIAFKCMVYNSHVLNKLLMPQGVESSMETQLLDQIVEKLKAFPETDLREILNHVDLLESCKAQAEKSDRSAEPLLAIAGTLSGSPLKSQEIETELENV